MRAIRLCLFSTLLLLSASVCHAKDVLPNAGAFAHDKPVVREDNVFECWITAAVEWDSYQGALMPAKPFGGKRSLVYEEPGNVVRWFGNVISGFERIQDGEVGNDIVLRHVFSGGIIRIRVWQDRLPWLAM